MDMIHEYPLQGTPPMMTHVYRINDQVVVAAKGGAERILLACRLPPEKKNNILTLTQQLSSKGYRVLGVANAVHAGQTFPLQQDEFNWEFTGLIALHDPPKRNAQSMMKEIYDARIDIKLVTGDHPGTAVNIAHQTGIHPLKFITGDEVMKMNEVDLQDLARSTAVYARMYPDAKLKLVKALKANGDIIAMTGDGVNDGPALKAADVGIAMGKKGTETARRAADLVLTDDDLGKIVIAIRQGRKIFSNLVKAIRYIISIHIPIILTASLPLIFGWKYPNIFSPLHVIFLELIMAPTCSIFFEKEPVELNTMENGPRDRNKGLFTTSELVIAILQGIMITVAVLFLYYFFMRGGSTIEETRTIVFTTLILSNVFLTFTNRSMTKSIIQTIRYKNILAPFILVISAGFLYILHFSPPVRELFQLAPIPATVFWLCLAMAFISVMWFEIYKILQPKK
jgi:Ca2+-transporting ATPase